MKTSSKLIDSFYGGICNELGRMSKSAQSKEIMQYINDTGRKGPRRDWSPEQRLGYLETLNMNNLSGQDKTYLYNEMKRLGQFTEGKGKNYALPVDRSGKIVEWSKDNVRYEPKQFTNYKGQRGTKYHAPIKHQNWGSLTTKSIAEPTAENPEGAQDLQRIMRNRINQYGAEAADPNGQWSKDPWAEKVKRPSDQITKYNTDAYVAARKQYDQEQAVLAARKEQERQERAMQGSHWDKMNSSDREWFTNVYAPMMEQRKMMGIAPGTTVGQQRGIVNTPSGYTQRALDQVISERKPNWDSDDKVHMDAQNKAIELWYPKSKYSKDYTNDGAKQQLFNERQYNRKAVPRPKNNVRFGSSSSFNPSSGKIVNHMGYQSPNSQDDWTVPNVPLTDYRQ